MKVAIVCPTIGQTKRGYERYLTDLSRALNGKVEITLFKGAGDCNAMEQVVPHFRRTGVLQRLFRNRFRYARYQLEFASFGLALFPFLLKGRYDLVHFIDPPMGRFLHGLRRICPKPYRLLFSNAGAVSYDASHWADGIHLITPSALNEACELGIAPKRLSMAPIGFHFARFVSSADRDELRQRFGISPGTCVILSVTTINRKHKRVHHLIEEISKLTGDFLLWIDGGLHPDGEPDLLELARNRLGNRFRHTHVPSEQIGDLYKLADLFVFTSLHESFGMTIVEAMFCGLPVIIHDSPHFRWLAGDCANYVDMSIPGALTAKLAGAIQNQQSLRRQKNPDELVRRFGWSSIGADYIEMYRKVLTGL